MWQIGSDTLPYHKSVAGGDWCPSSGPVPAAGQHNDARMNLAIALTAARYGAATANYAEVLRLLKTTDPASGKERVCGVRCRDVLTGVCHRSGTQRQPPAHLRRPAERSALVCSTLLGGWNQWLSAVGFAMQQLNGKHSPLGEHTLFFKERQK